MRGTTLFVTLFIIMLCCSSCFGRKASRHSSRRRHAKRHALKPNQTKQRVLNVDDFGAISDGKSDNFQVRNYIG